MHKAEAENYVLFKDITEDFSSETAFQIALRNCCKEVKEESGCIGDLLKTNKLVKHQKIANRASLVAQWLRICLLMQGTRVRALVWEDPTCRGAAGPVSHNY